MRVYNDLTRSKEELIPQREGHYTVYVCGPTVYDLFHLGNARPFIVYDTLRRYLEYRGNRVDFVQNFTDIDDKVIRRAAEEGCSCKELADRMIREYFVDAGGLNVRPATVHPRATECIPEMIEMIAAIKDKGFAYILSDGVYFDTGAYPDYGKLSRHPLDETEEAVQRVAHHDGKKSPNDFVLWKFKKEGEPAWASPWGEGRPGWHIECSAMSKKYLGETIDIHGGGQDLLFPHHENEVAQSEAANGKQFVRYWMHNGFINIDNEKMSKSVGNFFRVRDLAARYPYAVLRFFMLQAHYRMPINFSADLLDAAANGWNRIVTCARNLDFLLREGSDSEASAELDPILDAAGAEFNRAMDDDLNTADAFAAIFELVRELNSLTAGKALSSEQIRKGLDFLLRLLDVLGLDPLAAAEEEVPEQILSLAKARAAAKKEKNYAEADRLRNEIQAQGWKIEDTAQGPKISKA